MARRGPATPGAGPARGRAQLRRPRPDRRQRGGAARPARGPPAPRPRRPAKAASAPKSRPAADLPPEAAPIFERLRAWRAATAKEQGVPAYVIFHDATLREIATLGPSSLEELGTVSGVGENKLAKYGDQVLATLSDS
ncbi:HRDC domain-containing protein [Nonomuraea ferruginea]|uniref:HRDC domain-containing protein n=1 Tax=Nonomuraea ferruginea TaxID=46174 RepID=UPI00361233AE